MKTKSIVIVGLALLAGGIFLLVNRSESPIKPQTVATTNGAKAKKPESQGSYGGSFRIQSVVIADTKQSTIKPESN